MTVAAVWVFNAVKANMCMGSVHTQTIEGFWAMVERGIVCVFHRGSREYLRGMLLI